MHPRDEGHMVMLWLLSIFFPAESLGYHPLTYVLNLLNVPCMLS